LKSYFFIQLETLTEDLNTKVPSIPKKSCLSELKRIFKVVTIHFFSDLLIPFTHPKLSACLFSALKNFSNRKATLLLEVCPHVELKFPINLL